MKINKKIFFGIFFVLVVLLAVVISAATFSSSNPQFLSPGASSFSSLQSQNINIFPVFNQNLCTAGQDFILQIAPFGCEPSVVRSDLLEEQNVPVFCQIVATKINPLIKVEAIESMRFTGTYSKDVAGVGFHPARAAVRSSRTTLLNSPVLGNIGYAVIVLRQNPNESSMPDFVEGNLTANIRYDIENAFGVGQAQYYLPLFDDNEWENKYLQYGFWNGKGFLRADVIDDNGAVISVYLDKENRLSSFNLEKGQTSGQIFLPGFYCNVGLKLRLNSLEDPDTRTKLIVNGEIFEVADGEKFLENKCEVRSLEKQGLNQIVRISCRTDDGGERFDLRITPKIKLEIDGVSTSVSVGDKLYGSSDGKKSVYLAHIGTNRDSINEEDLFVYFMAMSQVKDKLSESELSSVDLLVKMLTYQEITGIGVMDFGLNIFKVYGGLANLADKFFREGKEISFPLDYNKEINFKGKRVKLLGLAGASDKELDGELKENYENAINDYRTIINEFFGEIEGLSSSGKEITFGETALINSIQLANFVNQKKTLSGLCKEFGERYPGSDQKPSICESELKLSNSESAERGLVINGKTKVISFEGIYEPTPDDYGAEISIRYPDGSISSVLLRKNQIFELGGGEGEEVYVVMENFQNIYFKFSEGKWQWLDGIKWITTTEDSLGRNLLRYKLFNKGLVEGERILEDSGGRKETRSSNQFIQLISIIDEDSIRVNTNLKASTVSEAIIKATISSSRKTLKKDIGDSFGSNYVFTLTHINLKKVAKVSVLPNVKYAGTEANISFKIGIEKREIQLSPDKIKEKLENLNKSIEKWESTSETLGDVVRGFNAMCLATGAILTAKNYFENLDGKSIARQQVMRGDGGWTDICSDEIKETGKSLDSCFLDNSKEIDRDVENRFKAMQGISITEDTLCSELDGIKTVLGDSVIDPRDSAKKIDLEDIYSTFTENDKDNQKCGKIRLSQARDLKTIENELALNPSPERKRKIEIERYKILSDINADVKGYAELNTLIADARNANFADADISWNVDKDAIKGDYNGWEVTNKDIDCPGCDYFEDEKRYNVKVQGHGAERYLFVLDSGGRGSEYGVTQAFKFESFDSGKIIISPLPNQDITQKFSYRKYDRTTYENPFSNPEVSYFETEPYRGSPAIVAFDTRKGWYAAIRQTLPGFGGIRAYDDSGRVASFWICNVGKNRKAEFNKESLGTGDDICQQFNPAVGTTYREEFPGLDKSETRTLVSKAIRAIDQASRAYEPGIRGEITILGQRIPVGKPAIDIPDFQCQDFMSPKDCNLLFNVCDPVVCPSSRCNLGGTYYVSDVVQSGIAGSALLCLANFPEVKVPICLSGIKAGMDGLISVQKNYQNCLQENLETGRTIGICDEIHSIYLCDFFWSQAAPLSELIIPKIFEKVKGQGGTRGGGEYLGVQSAWKNAQNSIDFFSNYYAVNSFDAFKLRSVGSVGGAICNNFISASYPSNIDILAPQSPPQYTAWFEERAFTTATVPPISQYKVFYHIFAGENIGAFYSVFLKSPEGTSFYQTNPILTISRGFIGVGDFASETTDFTAPSGYKELCVRVNQQEECGFGKVTTSFAIDYIQDKYEKQQASQTDINSEKECISGTRSLYSLVNPNIQAGVSDVVDPSLRNLGIVRICSTDQPGKGTSAIRWQPVGTCDGGRGDIKCWIDRDSVRNVIQSISLEEETLDKINENAQKLLREEGFIEPDFDEIGKLSSRKKINKITDSFIGKVLENIKKARLLLIRGDAYKDLILILIDALELETLPEYEAGGDTGIGETTTENGDKTASGARCEDVCEGVFNFCEEAECTEMGKQLGKNCQFVSGFFADSCVTVETTEEKPEFVVDTGKLREDCRGYFSLIKNHVSSDEESLFYLAILMQESGCNPNVRSDSSYGLMQIEEETFDDVCRGEILGVSIFNDVLGSENTEKNIQCGIMMYKTKYNEFSNGIFESWPYKNNQAFKDIVDSCVEKYPDYGFYQEREAALRGYNGWGCGQGANVNYVEEVLSKFKGLKDLALTSN